MMVLENLNETEWGFENVCLHDSKQNHEDVDLRGQKLVVH